MRIVHSKEIAHASLAIDYVKVVRSGTKRRNMYTYWLAWHYLNLDLLHKKEACEYSKLCVADVYVGKYIFCL